MFPYPLWSVNRSTQTLYVSKRPLCVEIYLEYDVCLHKTIFLQFVHTRLTGLNKYKFDFPGRCVMYLAHVIKDTH